jgi:type II secretory pathway component PulJ
MPQLFVAALLGAGLYAGYRYVARTAQRMAEEAKRAQDDLMRQATGAVEKNLGKLEYDPATGVYRPTNRA